MNRTKKLKMNAMMSIINRLTILTSGLILPRLIISNYGSETNGLVASINQFLSIVTFLDLGVGSVVQSALYRPLAQQDNQKISQIVIAAKQYFNKIAYFLVVYIGMLIVFYPQAVNGTLDYVSTAFLIFGLSLSILGQYYFGIVNELLLNASQRSYVQLGTEVVVVCLNLLASVLLINQGYSIQIVKLVAGLIYLIRPVSLSFYVKKHFELDDSVEITEDPLPQKWNGMGQHIAYTVQNNTDIVMLTFFSSLENISVYSVYNMVVNAMRTMIASFTTGLGSFFGDLLANEEIELLNHYFSRIEWLLHTIIVFLFGMTAVFIHSFVMFYTSGVEDVNYNAPIFALVLVLSRAAYSLRIPYQAIIFSAGHFKETQNSSVIEASINIIISLLLVNQYGLVGIAMASLISMAYRTLYLVVYLSKNILFRPIKVFSKQFFIDSLSFLSILLIGYLVNEYLQIETILDWIISAVIVGTFSLVFMLITNNFFYKDILSSYLSRLLKENQK